MFRLPASGGTSGLIFAALLIVVGCGPPADQTAPGQPPVHADTSRAEPTAGHARMVAVLSEVERQTSEDHPLLGDRPMRILREQLAGLPPDASPRERLRLHMQLGEQELRMGQLEQAVRNLELAHSGMEEMYRQRKVRLVAVYTTAFRLAIAYMRLGETSNCCRRNSPDSCIFPIRGGGVHEGRRGSENAVRYFTKVLELAPYDSELWFKSMWLLNVAHMTLGDWPDGVPEAYRITPLEAELAEKFPRFRNRAAELGLDLFDLAGGVIIDDFDNDGYLDLMMSSYDPSVNLRYFHNRGDGTFQDRTESANLTGLLGGFNLVQADYDNDGDIDVLVLRGAWTGKMGRIPNSLLRNNGNGTFTDVTFDAGMGEVSYPTQTASWADYDNDGDLDVYIGNEAVLDFSPPSQLFRNNGDGTFSDVAVQAGLQNHRFAKSVGWGDYDDDGDPDLYVSNLGQLNRLYRNNGDGTFTDVAPELNVAGPRVSFPAWFWDFDNDGVLDLYVGSYNWSGGSLGAYVRSVLGLPQEYEIAALYRGKGGGRFEEVALEWNLDDLSLPMGANFGDLNNDGFLDFYLGTGYPDYEGLVPNVMYLNQGGKRFADITVDSGLGMLQKGHGVAFGDIDNDGDQDLIEQVGGFFAGDKFFNVVFENPGFGTRWIAVKLEGQRSNRSAIGARLRVDVRERGTTRTIYRHVNSGGSFGANPLRQTIGLGHADRIERLEVYWPTTGEPQVFVEVPLDRIVRITEDEDRLSVVDLAASRPSGDQTATGRRH